MRLKKKTTYLCRLAVLSALALALSVLESIFTPVLPPGAKAGVSNIVTMYAAISLGLPAALSITLVKAVFAFAPRGVIAFGMSFVGGVLSAVVLFFLFRFGKGKLGTIGVSVVGAAVHNAAQGVFSLLIFGKAFFAYLPILLFLSLPSGVLTGTILYAVRGVKHRKESL